jgi:predicted TIM-barrel fold metal-dependent hydrolase
MNREISRRRFLKTTMALATLSGNVARSFGIDSNVLERPTTDDIPIIDTHIHLFDPTRPQGVPWPDRTNRVLYKPALPKRYRGIAAPLGIRGAIEIECSPWLEDNQWVLDIAKQDTIIVGTVGALEPGRLEFARQLERFHGNPLFRGIRYRDELWGKELKTALEEPKFVADLKLLANAGLVLDTGDRYPHQLAENVARITDLVPNLKVVVDTMGAYQIPQDAGARAIYDSSMQDLAKRSQVYVKITELFLPPPHDLDHYRQHLANIYSVFGPSRLLYSSDWPNSDLAGTFNDQLSVVRAFFISKGRENAEKFFWKNSVAAYGWIKRDPGQPT